MARTVLKRAALRHWRPRIAGALLILPALVLVASLYVVPILRLAVVSLGDHGPSMGAYASLFSEWSYQRILLRTFRLSAFVVVGCMILGYPIGYVLAFSSPRLRAILSLMVLLPFWTSVLVRNYAWIYILQKGGALSVAVNWFAPAGVSVDVLYNEVGVFIGMVNTLLPFMVLPIFVAIRAQDSALREAAGSLGASPSRIFFAVTLPLSRTGVYAGSLLVFTTAVGFFITPALLGGGRVLMAATFINQQVEDFVNWPLAAAASVVLLVIVTALIVLYRRVTGSQGSAAAHAVG